MAGEKLSGYRGKRDFTRTPEPAGREPGTAAGEPPRPAGGPYRFVVHRHRARRLHYDLRFEIGGVLASWAVPKGPTLDPTVRRAAVQVEDHPIEYLDFEGVIPGGEYGAGDVIVWDRGTWEPHATSDPAAAVAAGELHADLHGEKLRGRLVLVRTGPPGQSKQWLLLHKRDEHAVTGWDPEDHPASVLSGRTSDEVRADQERVWRPDLPPARASVPVRRGAGGPPAAGKPEPGKPVAGKPVPREPGKRDPGKREPGKPVAGKPVPREPGAAVAAPSPAALAALDALGDAGTWEVFGRRLRLTNLGKTLFPARGDEPAVTKRELIRYAALIAPVILPYLAGRVLNMNRYPHGAGTAGFWHRHLPGHAPSWLPRWPGPAAGRRGTGSYLVVDEPAALVWAANFGALEWHAWTARTDQPDQPSYALIDIDPGPATSWEDVLVLGRLHRTALAHLGVRGQPKLTGRRGIQIWIPVAPGLGFAGTRAWVERLSRAIGSVVPDLVSWQWDVAGRGGKARLDYTQNTHHKTLVAPYSPRAAPGAPVSAPIGWDELDDPALRPDGVTIRTVFGRLAARGDPFRSVLAPGQVLPPID
jgi:bifunctional non-homologous end joining protein LigD